MKEMTREEFFTHFTFLAADLVTELWEDGYDVEEAEEYLEWMREKTEIFVD